MNSPCSFIKGPSDTPAIDCLRPFTKLRSLFYSRQAVWRGDYQTSMASSFIGFFNGCVEEVKKPQRD
jgi:hypothetical protein